MARLNVSMARRVPRLTARPRGAQGPPEASFFDPVPIEPHGTVQAVDDILRTSLAAKAELEGSFLTLDTPRACGMTDMESSATIQIAQCCVALRMMPRTA